MNGNGNSYEIEKGKLRSWQRYAEQHYNSMTGVFRKIDGPRSEDFEAWERFFNRGIEKMREKLDVYRTEFPHDDAVVFDEVMAGLVRSYDTMKGKRNEARELFESRTGRILVAAFMAIVFPKLVAAQPVVGELMIQKILSSQKLLALGA
jgi:hypothetical protein